MNVSSKLKSENRQGRPNHGLRVSRRTEKITLQSRLEEKEKGNRDRNLRQPLLPQRRHRGIRKRGFEKRGRERPHCHHPPQQEYDRRSGEGSQDNPRPLWLRRPTLVATVTETLISMSETPF